MRQYLTVDYLLRGDKDSYRIVDHIGDGSSCLVYKCESLKDHSLYIVKEFYPSYLNLTRNLDTGWISCKEDDKEDYAAGLLRFNNSIRIQKALRTRDNKVFVIHDDFEQNGTKYVAVAIYEGDIYLHNENMSLYERMQFCLSVAEHVKKCHAAGYLCLDIKPDNIFHIPDTAEFAMFFDFDSLIRIEDVESSHIIYYSERWGVEFYSKKNVATTSENYAQRVSIAYITEKVRQSDVDGNVYVQRLFDQNVLVFEQTVNGNVYNTYIYSYDGYLRELFARADLDNFYPQTGQKILKLNSFDIEKTNDNLLKATVTEEDGSKETVFIAVHSK